MLTYIQLHPWLIPLRKLWEVFYKFTVNAIDYVPSRMVDSYWPQSRPPPLHDDLSLAWSFSSSNNTSITSVTEPIHLVAGCPCLFSSTFLSIRVFSRDLLVFT